MNISEEPNPYYYRPPARPQRDYDPIGDVHRIEPPAELYAAIRCSDFSPTANPAELAYTIPNSDISLRYTSPLPPLTRDPRSCYPLDMLSRPEAKWYSTRFDDLNDLCLRAKTVCIHGMSKPRVDPIPHDAIVTCYDVRDNHVRIWHKAGSSFEQLHDGTYQTAISECLAAVKAQKDRECRYAVLQKEYVESVLQTFETRSREDPAYADLVWMPREKKYDLFRRILTDCIQITAPVYCDLITNELS